MASSTERFGTKKVVIPEKLKEFLSKMFHKEERSNTRKSRICCSFTQDIAYAPSHICKDENGVSALTNVFLETFINPFIDSLMMSISTGIQTAENVTKDLLSAQQLG